MSGTAEAWPGQEVTPSQQWPGQEVTPATGRGELGYAAAPPLPPDRTSPMDTQAPAFLAPTEFGAAPDELPKSMRLDPSRDTQPPLTNQSEYPDLPFSGDYGQAVPPDAARAIIGAAGEGWRAVDPILAPEAQAAQYRIWGPVGGDIINELYNIPSDFLKAGGALMYGVSELANQVTGNPEVGRDVMAAQNMLPFFHAGIPAGAIRPYAVPETRANPMMDAFDRAEAARAEQLSRPQPTSDVENNIAKVQAQIGVRPDQLPPTGTPADTAPPGVPPGTAVPTDLRLRAAIDAAGTPPPEPAPGFVPPGTPAPVDRVPPGAAGPETVPYAAAPTASAPAVDQPAPGPQSGGAAASRDGTDPAVLTAKTPAQALNDFRTSVTQTARDRASPGVTPGTVEDHNVYVPGVTRLESARVFDPEVAGNHDALRDIDPAYKTAADKTEQDNHDILKDTYLQQAGDTNSVAALEDQRNAVSPNALGVFQNERPVSAQPVADAIQAIKDSPAWKIDAVRNVMQKVEKGLYDANGNLETMPSQLYGARQNLTTIRDSNALTQEASDAKTARYQLGQVLAPLDQVIGEGSNGYKDVYLPQWANYSRLIDQQRYLQSKTLGAGKVTGADGNLTANGMQKLLDQIAVDKGKRGNNPAKTLTEPQLDNLVAIRNELAAMQYRDQLAKSSGSPTVKKAAAAARLGNPVLNAARETAIHGVLAHTTGGAGNVVYQLGVKPIMERGRERKAAAIMATMRNRLLSTTIPTE